MVLASLNSYSLFVLRSESNYYDAGNILSTNWWSLAGLVNDYGGLVLGSMAFLTQLLALFGILVELNLLMWTTILGTIGLTYQLTLTVLYFMAYNSANSKKSEKVATADALMSLILTDI